MSVFTEEEIAYLEEQRIGRLATVGPGSRPHVVPVGFSYDAETDTIRISGHDFEETKKFRDAERIPNVAFVVDDLASIDPWRPRGIEIRGQAETLRGGGERTGPGPGSAWIQIEPTRISVWGINQGSGRAVRSRTVSV